MHVDDLAIAFRPAHNGRDDDQRVLVNEVADTSLISRRVAGVGEDIEFEGLGEEGEEAQEKQR